MRLALLVLCFALVDCKKSPRPTLSRIPDSTLGKGAATFESDQAVLFHTVYKYPGHAGQALEYYAAEMQTRGARRVGDSYIDDNVERTGNVGMYATATVKDPTLPGVAMYVTEVDEATFIDVWENVPRTP